MIAFKDVDQLIVSRTDAEGTDAYDINLDRIPAINGAQHVLTSFLSPMLEARKFSGEALRDLNVTLCYQSTMFAQVDLAASAPSGQPQLFNPWGIIAVYPEFVAAGPMQPVPDNVDSHTYFRPDIRFVAPTKSAKRYTQEQWAFSGSDPFMQGSPLNTNPHAKEYGYMYGGRAINPGGPASRPTLSITGLAFGKRHQVAVSFLKTPNDIPQMPLGTADPLYGTSQLEWPASMQELIATIALGILAIKVGDATTQYTLSEAQKGQLIRMLA